MGACFVQANIAETEVENIRAAHEAGVNTMETVCWGEDPPCGEGRSYLIVTAVPGEALERCGEDFLHRHADDPRPVEQMTDKLISLVRSLHGSGYVHRDLYTSHVFLAEEGEQVELYLIDLARMFRPRWRRFRWRVKDLAQLKYSMPRAWIKGYWQTFLYGYLGGGGDAELRKWDRAVDHKVAVIQRRAARKRWRGK